MRNSKKKKNFYILYGEQHKIKENLKLYLGQWHNKNTSKGRYKQQTGPKIGESFMPTSFDIFLSKWLPDIMIKGAQIIEFRNGKQIWCEFHKLLITVSARMGLPEWLDDQTILWVHHKISPQIIKHYTVFWTVELDITRNH